MKKLIFLFLTLLIVGCATTRKTVFFERVTPQPLSVIDSLNTVHGLSVPTNLDSWGKTYFIGSDSVMTTVYVLTEKKRIKFCISFQSHKRLERMMFYSNLGKNDNKRTWIWC